MISYASWPLIKGRRYWCRRALARVSDAQLVQVVELRLLLQKESQLQADEQVRAVEACESGNH